MPEGSMEEGGDYGEMQNMGGDYGEDGGGFGDESRPETGPDFGDEEDVKLPGVDDLPLFANPDARKIDLDIKAKEEQIELLVDEIEDMKDRVKVMKEHFKKAQLICYF